MNGARALAYDYILPRLQPGMLVLDLGAGGAPLAGMMVDRGCQVVALDKDVTSLERARDRYHAETGRAYSTCRGEACNGGRCTLGRDDYDLIVAVYAIQHMIGQQALVWGHFLWSLRPGGQVIHVGRYRPDAPVLEADRGDPLIADNERTIETLALNSGLRVLETRLYRYEGDAYGHVDVAPANAIVALVERPA